jgi:hypothetical protein
VPDTSIPIYLFVGGYAIGTAQIVGIDWWREIRAHRRQLRLLRAILKGAMQFNGRFSPVFPSAGRRPKAPTFGPRYHDTVTSVDFALTGHYKDGTLENLITWESTCDELRLLNEKACDRLDELDKPGSPLTISEQWAAAERAAKLYNETLDELRRFCDYTIGEMDRRLALATLRAQFSRGVRRRWFRVTVFLLKPVWGSGPRAPVAIASPPAEKNAVASDTESDSA